MNCLQPLLVLLLISTITALYQENLKICARTRPHHICNCAYPETAANVYIKAFGVGKEEWNHRVTLVNDGSDFKAHHRDCFDVTATSNSKLTEIRKIALEVSKSDRWYLDDITLCRSDVAYRCSFVKSRYCRFAHCFVNLYPEDPGPYYLKCANWGYSRTSKRCKES